MYDITHYVGGLNVRHQSNYCSIGKGATKYVQCHVIRGMEQFAIKDSI
jgi:hypothetical protein